jgi:hypothetical protein
MFNDNQDDRSIRHGENVGINSRVFRQIVAVMIFMGTGFLVGNIHSLQFGYAVAGMGLVAGIIGILLINSTIDASPIDDSKRVALHERRVERERPISPYLKYLVLIAFLLLIAYYSSIETMLIWGGTLLILFGLGGLFSPILEDIEEDEYGNQSWHLPHNKHLEPQLYENRYWEGKESDEGEEEIGLKSDFESNNVVFEDEEPDDIEPENNYLRRFSLGFLIFIVTAIGSIQLAFVALAVFIFASKIIDKWYEDQVGEEYEKEESETGE